MVTAIILVILNVLFIVAYPKMNIKDSNDYSRDKYIFIRKKAYKILIYSNIVNILSHVLYLAVYLNHYNLNVLNVIVLGMQAASLVPLLLNTSNYIQKNTLVFKKILDLGDILLLISIMTISISELLGSNTKFLLLLEIVNVVPILAGLIILLIKLIQLKNYTCYTIKQNQYLPDVNFARKVEISKIINYFVYILAYVLIILIKFNYAYIVYALIIAINAYSTIKELKELGRVAERVNQSVSIAREAPGVEFAFYFQKALLNLKRKIFIIVGLIITIIMFYGVGDGPFIYSSFALYNLLLYMILTDKVSLIKYTRTLNKNLIDRKIYSIKEDKNVTYVDPVNIFGIQLYRIIVDDGMIYETNLIPYDPELLLKVIDIRINKYNKKDYIFNERILYEDDIEEIDIEELKKLLEEEEEASK